MAANYFEKKLTKAIINQVLIPLAKEFLINNVSINGKHIPEKKYKRPGKTEEYINFEEVK